MVRGTDRLNRTLLSLLGVLLVGLGAFGLLRGAGAFGGEGADAIVSPWLRAEARERQVWLVPLVAAGAIVLLWLGLSWLLAQLPRTPRVHQVTLGRTEHATVVAVRAVALAEALAADVRRVEGVTEANARVVREQPLTIDLDVGLEEGTDLTAVSRAIADRPKRRLLQALEVPDVDLRAKLRLSRPSSRRVA